jgi:L-ascorbate metabolism protein UlaG (beta-lactamase superfamily)
MNHRTFLHAVLLSSSILGAAALPAHAAPAAVVVTPLGSHDGEFCALDRALIFEDPDGTRVLYDPGRTVRGGDDPRLGRIDVVLLSHVHGDHLGDVHSATANAGTCAKPEFTVKDQPSSNTLAIVVAKKAKFPVGGELNAYFAGRLRAAGGDPAQLIVLRFGASTKVGGVEIASVPALHTNGLDPGFIDGDLGTQLKSNGLTADVGPAGAFVVKFTNGLVAYLSGDTGIMADQELVIRNYYKANLAVLNIGGNFTTGPVEAAYVVNELVKPKSVIPSHANEGATLDGKLLPDSKTAAFVKASKIPVYVPLSGKPMSFDGSGKCIAGC